MTFVPLFSVPMCNIHFWNFFGFAGDECELEDGAIIQLVLPLRSLIQFGQSFRLQTMPRHDLRASQLCETRTRNRHPPSHL